MCDAGFSFGLVNPPEISASSHKLELTPVRLICFFLFLSLHNVMHFFSSISGFIFSHTPSQSLILNHNHEYLLYKYSYAKYRLVIRNLPGLYFYHLCVYFILWERVSTWSSWQWLAWYVVLWNLLSGFTARTLLACVRRDQQYQLVRATFAGCYLDYEHTHGGRKRSHMSQWWCETRWGSGVHSLPVKWQIRMIDTLSWTRIVWGR